MSTKARPIVVGGRLYATIAGVAKRNSIVFCDFGQDSSATGEQLRDSDTTAAFAENPSSSRRPARLRPNALSLTLATKGYLAPPGLAGKLRIPMAPQSLVTAFNVRSVTFIMSLVPTAVAELTILVGIPISPQQEMRLAFSATRVRDGMELCPSSIFSVEHCKKEFLESLNTFGT